MYRTSYVIAALTVIAFASPSFAEDAPKAGQTAKTERSVPPEANKGGPGWHGARAEQVVVGDRRHHHHRHHHHAM
jgi:hypothetical protein